MNWIQRMMSAAFSGGWEQRSSLENPQSPLSFPAEWLLDIFNGGRTDSGIRVSEMTALQVGTVYACVNIISNGVSGLPFHVYERLFKDHRQGKRLATSHILWDLLHSEPNPEMTVNTLLKTMMVHGLLWGNSYAEIQRDGNNQITAIWPRNPARTRPVRLTRPLSIEGTVWPVGTLIFETTENLMGNSFPSAAENTDVHIGQKRLILAEDMLHIPGLTLDGRLGQSTVYLSRQIVGLALACEKYGAKFFGNGARPAGILTLPNKLEDKAIETLRRSWAEAHGGENQFKVAVLEQGVKFEKIAATPEEGQMLATRNYQRSDICAIFNVPLHMVAASEKGGKSNVEQNSLEFVLYCLNPWLKAYEEEFTRKLFPKMGRSANKFFPKFDPRKLMYPDADSRAKFYSSGRQWGYLNANDIRELEDMNPIEGSVGDTFWMPVNMQDAQDPITPGMNATADFHASPKGQPYSPQANQQHALKLAKASAPKVAPAAPAAPEAPAAPAAGKGKGKRSACPACEEGSCANSEHRYNPGHADQPRILGRWAQDAKYPLPVIDSLNPEYVMRHGTTDANLQDVYRGWGTYGLDAQGRVAAEATAEWLKDKGITRIVTSTLLRHMQTAQIVAAKLGHIPIEVDEGFRTINVGMFTGRKRSEAADDLQWYLDNPEEEIPGGEAVDDFQARSANAFARMRIKNAVDGPMLAITSRSNVAALKYSNVAGTDVKVAEPGGVYRMDATNNLQLVYGTEVSDTLAGT